MRQILLHTPDGVRDIYNEECAQKEALISRVNSVFNMYGYRAIETPTFEFFDVFGKEVGTTPSRELYKFFDREGNTLVLRPDFTPSIARAASKYLLENNDPIRLSYRGNTFINHSNYRGRLKENTQMGVELIGMPYVDADAEVIAMVVESLLKAGLNEFQISVGHVQYFENLAKEAGLDEDTKEELKELIRNKNSFGVEKVLSQFEIPEQTRKALVRLPGMFGGVEVLKEAYGYVSGEEAKQSIERLMELVELLTVYGFDKYISVDLSMMGNYMYYTGIIFRGYTYGTGDAIVKGGRYDNLLQHFGKDAPSIGFVVVIDQLLNAMKRQHQLPDIAQDRYLIIYPSAQRAQAIQLARAYRAQGSFVQMHLQDAPCDGLSEETLQLFAEDKIIRL